MLAQEIMRRPSLGIKVVGFLDDFKTTDSQKKEIKILGKISDFPEVVRREFINKVFITIYHDSSIFLNLIEQAREMGIAVQVIPQGFELTTGEIFKYNIGIIPILEYSEVRNLRRQAGKRFFDLIVSFFLAILCLPVFIIIGVLIEIDSTGPAFYVSKRYGRRAGFLICISSAAWFKMPTRC